MAAAALAVAVCGCSSVVNRNSISFTDPVTHSLGPVCTVMTAPLVGDVRKLADCKDLKKGTSSEVLFLEVYYPLFSIGEESLKSAMATGAIKDLHYADYSVRYFVILGWYTVTAYGK